MAPRRRKDDKYVDDPKKRAPRRRKDDKYVKEPKKRAPPACRRKHDKYVEDPKERATTRCKRGQGLRDKSAKFHKLTGDPIALFTIGPKGKCHSVCEPTIPEMTSAYRRLQGNVMRMEDWGEWLNRVEKVCSSCVEKKDCDLWIRKCIAFLRCLHERSKDLEKNPAVKTAAAAGDDSGIGNDFKILNGNEINSTDKNWEATPPAFVAFNEDRVDHGISFTSPADLAATGGEGSVMAFNPLCSDIKDIELFFACFNECFKDPSIQTVLQQPARSDREWMGSTNNHSVNAGAGVGVVRDALNDGEIDALLFAFSKKLGNGIDCQTPPVDSAAGIDFDEFCNNHLADIIILPEVDGHRT